VKENEGYALLGDFGRGEKAPPAFPADDQLSRTSQARFTPIPLSNGLSLGADPQTPGGDSDAGSG
jgi:hypothetical protein